MTLRSWQRWIVPVALAVALVVPMASAGYADPPGVSEPYTARPVVSDTTDETGRALGFWEALEKESTPFASFSTTDETGRALGFWEAVENASK